MGMRGPGAQLQRRAGERVAAKPRRLPWKRAGLSRAERVIAFVQWLPVTKGIRAGKRMRLLDDQKAFIRKVYDADGTVRVGIDSKPRGNGKTGLCAGLALCHLIGPEAEPRGEVYSAAVDRTQSGKLFAEMEAIIMAVPEFAERVNIKRFNKQLEVLEGDGAGSVYEALSSDARKGHSLAPSLWIFDELAQVADAELLDNLETAMGKRDRSLGLIISTQAESDDHRLSQMIDDGLSGVDPSIVVHLLAAPADADPFDEKVLRSVNPAFDKYLNVKDVLADMRKAQRIPAFEPRYRNRRLNQRVDSNAENRIVQAAVWIQGNMQVDRAALKGRRCFGGLDLSGKHDLTALVLVFPSDDPEPTYDVLPFFWTPQDQLPERRAPEQERFRQWIAAGQMIATPGKTIGYDFVAAEMTRLSEEFDIACVAFDKYRIDYLKPELADAGCEVPLEQHQQGFISMFPAVERFAELALAGRLRHGGHPVLTAAVAGAIVVHDAAGNMKIDKDKSNGRGPVRVDGAVALAMALNVASRFVEAPKPPSLDGFLANPVMVL